MSTRRDRSEILMDWCDRCFGHYLARHRQERVARVVEEAIELAQSEGMHREMIDAIAANVYAKEKGNPFQEAGGLAITLLVYCAAVGFDPDTVELVELRRILAKSPEHFRDRQNAKADAGIAGRVHV